jgi:hypothetical protein
MSMRTGVVYSWLLRVVLRAAWLAGLGRPVAPVNILAPGRCLARAPASGM